MRHRCMRHRRRLATSLVTAMIAGAFAALTAGPATADPAVTLRSNPAVETVRGPAKSTSMPGGGDLVVHAFGAVTLHSAAGGTVWERGSDSLFRDWGVRWQTNGYVNTPQLAWGSNPADPLALKGAAIKIINDAHPYAVGDLTRDQVPDVAVAETVGISLSPEESGSSGLFDVPGSNLHVGTFVTVLDGRTGRTLYDELDPGYVTQLVMAGDRLVVGDETGDPKRAGGAGQWKSLTTVKALSFTPSGQRLAAHRDWAYSTGAAWARVLDMAATGTNGIVFSWSDTPLGLGVPGPPDGHVVLLDQRTGARRWDVRTDGYPALLGVDSRRSEVAAVQTTDPFTATGYTVTGLRLADGHTTVNVRRDGALPLSLAMSPAGGDRPDWVVGAVNAKVSFGAQINYEATAGLVSSIDPGRGRERWSKVLPASSSLNVPEPAGLTTVAGSIVAASWNSIETPTPATPRTWTNSLMALNAGNGGLRWKRLGDTGDPFSLSPVPGPHGGAVRTVTQFQQVETYAVADGTARLASADSGDVLSTVPAHVSDPRREDLVAGDESGEVYAFDGKDLASGSGRPRVLWQTPVGGPVHGLRAARVDGSDVLVAAATDAVGVLDAKTGRVRLRIPAPGSYIWTVTVGMVGSEPVVVVPGASLTAYSLRTGRTVWSYRPPAGASFADVVYGDGVFATEYSSPGQSRGTPATVMAAVGIDATTGHAAWTVPADPATTARGQLWNGVVAGPGIPGAGGHGMATTWQTATGSGRVDVRDIRTGALYYSDTDDVLDPHTGYVTDPSVGLIAVGQAGSALVTPDGAKESTMASGMSMALIRTAHAGSALMVADADIRAFPTDLFQRTDQDTLADLSSYNSGTMAAADFTGDGDEVAVSTPPDWLGYQVVSGESGYRIGGYLDGELHGLEILSLATGTASAARPKAAPAPPTGPTGPAKNSFVPEPDRRGTALPQSIVHPRGKRPLDAAPPGFSPAQIRAYLGPRGDGSGRTISIVDAYDDPHIAADVERFSEQFKLPGVCGAGGDAGNCFTLDVVRTDGVTGPDANWSLETSLDVEWVHAIAPKARVRLVEARDAGITSLFQAVDTAAAAKPDAVSMSWGVPFEFSDETFYDKHCAISLCVVSTGDSGHPGSYPAYNPSALSVGGTTLTLADDGSVSSEQAWAKSGGGLSYVERVPSYQRSLPGGTGRQIPDVAFDADPRTGVAVYDSVPYAGQSGWFQVGGTSLSAPVWAATLTDADQLRVQAGRAPLTANGSAAQRAVYGLTPGTLADITTGPANGFCPDGCVAGPGYDEVTGLGSPRRGIDALLAATG